MTEENKHTETFVLPEGVSVTVTKGIVTFKGPKGEVSKSFLNPLVDVTVDGNQLIFVSKKFIKNEKKLVKTYLAHANNLCKGVTEGHTYKLKICSGHFPMNVSHKGNILEIKNFIGESVPRTLQIKEGVDLKLDGNDITITGIDKELTSQVAASIEKLTRRAGFDRRRFQDGIYIVEKDGHKIE